MAGLPEENKWEPEIYQFETTDPVVGGVPNPETGEGMDNIPTLQLANRTGHLKDLIDSISATLAGLNFATQADINTAIAGLLDGAPENLNTLNELSEALNDNENFATWVIDQLNKASPVGAEQLWTDTTPPPGYLFEDRGDFDRALYPKLTEHVLASGMYDPTGANIYQFGPGDGSTTLQLPESRGEGLRIWDQGRGVNPGRGLGIWEDWAIPEHSHDYWSPIYGGDSDRGSSNSVWSIDGAHNRTTGGVKNANVATEVRIRTIARGLIIRAY